MILIVDMNWKKDSLAFNEFVSPIVSVVKPFEKCTVRHFLDVDLEGLEGYSKVILSGTTLKDHATLKQIDKFNWIEKCEKPTLGICAGMQTIASVFGVPLTPCLQIGMVEISTLKENQLFQDNFKAYTLHNYSVESNNDFETLAKSTGCIQAVKHKQKNIYGILFHPEVRNQEILRCFVKLNQ
jgi:GMP synthase (glutamine-hydrolysing)